MTGLPASRENGAAILSAIEEFAARFIAWPNDHAGAAHAAWCAHTHLMSHWDTTPRAAALSPEPASGKSRVLEVTATLVPRPVLAVNTTPAYLFRKVSDPDGQPTILYDEIDTVFGPKAKDNEEVRGMLNAGWRRGAVAGRARQDGSTEDLPAYSAVMLAGLGALPDTILSRAIVWPMRRRRTDEYVEPWRIRQHEAEGHELRDRLAAWAASVSDQIGESWPVMPEGVEDRAADIWEPLVVVADLAGGEWPERIRRSAVAAVAANTDKSVSLGVRLLRDLREVFRDEMRMSTADVLNALTTDETKPWCSLRGEPLDATGLARLLSPYDVSPIQMRMGSKNVRGYEAADLTDAWERYAPRKEDEKEEDTPSLATPATPATSATPVMQARTPANCVECGHAVAPGRTASGLDRCSHCDERKVV